MTSVIESINQQVRDTDADLAQLLPRAVFLSTVLRQKPVTAWLKSELDGYGDDDPVPSYRQAQGATLAALMPGQGWVEAPMSDSARKKLSHFDLRQDMAEIQQAYAVSLKAGGQRFDLEGRRLKELQELVTLDTKLSLAVPMEAFALVVQSVRIGVSLWTRELMHARVKGEGMVFSDQERAAAGSVTERLDEILEQATAKAHQRVEAIASSRGGLLSRLLGI